MIEEIKELYSQLDHKTKFIALAGKKFNRSPNGLKQNWFATFWNIPVDFQPKVKNLLIAELEKQKQTA